jgi:hypothetical protein
VLELLPVENNAFRQGEERLCLFTLQPSRDSEEAAFSAVPI